MSASGEGSSWSWDPHVQGAATAWAEILGPATKETKRPGPAMAIMCMYLCYCSSTPILSCSTGSICLCSLCFQECCLYFCGMSKGTALCVICVPDHGSVVSVSFSIFGSCGQSHYRLDLRTGKCSSSTCEVGTWGAPGVLRAQSALSDQEHLCWSSASLDADHRLNIRD